MALTISGLSKTYPNGVKALRNLSLTIGNEMFGLLGPNGAGKSSLMRTVATLQDPDSGSVTLDGIDVLKDKNAVRRVLGYLPQEFGVYPRMSALDMLHHLAIMKGISNKTERNQMVDALLNQTNLWAARKKSLSTYSGGMKQRFGIAQALLANPKLIIVDDVRELCPRMAIIASGQVLLEGSPAAALDLLNGKIFSKVVATDDELRALEASFSVISTHLVGGLHEVRIYAGTNPGADFKPVDSGLEDVYFLNLATQAASQAAN